MKFSNCEKNLTSHPVLKGDNKTQLLSNSSNESGGKTRTKNWSTLDSIIVEHVYSFLNRIDQFSMSLVCKNWLKEYESPLLWQNFTFYLPEYVCSCDSCPGIKFPRTYGRFFRYVEIICKRVRTNLINDIFIQLQTFLDFITNNSQLRSIKFIDMNKYFIQLDDDDYSTLFQTTTEFFTKQKNLELLEFQDSLFLREEGAKILKAAFENHTRTLKTIIIKGFVTDSIEIEGSEIDDFELYCSLKRHIINLTTLQTDYTQLLENVIMARSDEPGKIGKLLLLEVLCDGSKRQRFQGIIPQAWQGLCRICPDLKVHMVLTSTSLPRNDYSFYIVPYIPIHHLEYHISTPLESREVDIGELFQHLVYCGCNDHLEHLTIVWMPLVGDLSVHLIPFLQAAQKLRKLHICLRFPVYGIEDLFIAWLRRRPLRLESAYISITQVRREDDFQYLLNLVSEYSPLLQVLGLNVNVVINQF